MYILLHCLLSTTPSLPTPPSPPPLPHSVTPSLSPSLPTLTPSLPSSPPHYPPSFPHSLPLPLTTHPHALTPSLSPPPLPHSGHSCQVWVSCVPTQWSSATRPTGPSALHRTSMTMWPHCSEWPPSYSCSYMYSMQYTCMTMWPHCSEWPPSPAYTCTCIYYANLPTTCHIVMPLI